MSNWDFGYGREPADPRDRPYPPPPEGEGGWGGSGYQADAVDQSGPQAAPYPLTYERDVFDGRPPWSTGPQHTAPPPTGPWPAGPRAAPQRPTAPRQTRPQSAAPPPPADQFDGGQYSYAPGQSGYADGRHGYAAGRPGDADPMRSLYPDSRGGEEAWLDEARGPGLDGPWWDPDSWPGWRRWLIPAGVAVLAAAIGAGLVLLTGLHTGASAAIGPAGPATLTGPMTSAYLTVSPMGWPGSGPS